MLELLISSFKKKGQLLNTWLFLEPIGDRPRARLNHTLTNIGNKLYLHGGNLDGDELWEYDIDSNSRLLLEPSGSKPSARQSHTLTNIGDKLYLHGGDTSNINANDELWEYDVNNNSWLRLNPTSNKPSARFNHVLTNVGDKLYLHGGANSSRNNGELWKYDTSTHTWSMLEPIGIKPSARRSHALTSIGDKLYLHGGNTSGIGSSSSRSDELWEYDTINNTWSLLEPTGAKPIRRFGHTLTSIGDKLYLHGGRASSTSDELWEYDIENNAWSLLEPTGGRPSARYYHTLTSIGDKIYLHGGFDGNRYFGDLWENTIGN